MMRKKKENDKESNSKRKTSNQKSSKNQNSILKINEDKMNEFSKSAKDKKLKELTTEVNKNIEEIACLKKDMALKRINSRGFSEYISDTPSKISKIEDSNKSIEKEIQYIKSGKQEADYILSTCNLIGAYMELEDEERELMIQEHDNIEQNLYEINQKKNDITDEYMRIIDPNYVSFRKSGSRRRDIYCEICNR